MAKMEQKRKITETLNQELKEESNKKTKIVKSKAKNVLASKPTLKSIKEIKESTVEEVAKDKAEEKVLILL